MDIIPCGAIDSTSTRASELLAQGRKAPFAVWATAQTGGRGRRGHTWESPVGNLFLTIALPPEAASDSGQDRGSFGCLPLKAAVLMARFIEKRVGLRPTLKWPNDILMEGRKVGGLLLEMSSAGGKPAEVLVGIGLNLNVAPSFAGVYAATSLAAVTGKSQDVESWAKDLVAVFSSDWNELPLTQVPQAFGPYGMALGSVWREMETGDFYRSERLDQDGSLVLTSLRNQIERTLTSVDHGFTWIYLGEHEAPLIVADVGNSRIKVAAFGGSRESLPKFRYDFTADCESSALQAPLEEMRAALRLPSGWPLHILSVNPIGAGALSAACIANGLTPLTITKMPVRRWGPGYDLTALGIDRLAAMEGYLATMALADRDRGVTHAVIVSAGTATTLDVVTVSGEHLGGWIIPGLKVALRSLRQATQLLPLLEPELQETARLGHGTVEALEQGVLNMTLGAIARAHSLVSVAEAQIVSSIILTGGQAPLLAPHVKAHLAPDLVLTGARQLVLGGA